jgi:hypothetical protein
MSEDKLEREYAPVQCDESAALVGGFAYDAAHDRWSWSPEVFRIHGFEPHDVVPTTQLILFHADAGDREQVTETLAQAMVTPGRFSLAYRLTDAQGSSRRVLLLGSGSALGGGVLLRGQLVDLTAWQDQILNDDLGPVVDDFRAHRAVIEQAKGIVIQLFAVDAEEAFDRLRRCSQAANVKVRDLAEYLVIAAAQDRTPAKIENSLSLAEIFEVLAAESDAD